MTTLLIVKIYLWFSLVTNLMGAGSRLAKEDNWWLCIVVIAMAEGYILYLIYQGVC